MSILSKKIITNLTLFIFFIIASNSIIECSNEIYTEESMKVEDHNIAVGSGTLAVLIFAALGIVICVVGQATAMPGVMIIVGIALPLIVFVICAFWPAESEEDKSYKAPTNSYIVARWFYFSFMLCLFFALMVPVICLLQAQVIPERVDSRALKEADDKYKKMLMEKIEDDKKKSGQQGMIENNNMNINVNPEQQPQPQPIQENENAAASVNPLVPPVNKEREGFKRKRKMPGH